MGVACGIEQTFLGVVEIEIPSLDPGGTDQTLLGLLGYRANPLSMTEPSVQHFSF